MGELVGGGSLSWRMVIRFGLKWEFYVKRKGLVDIFCRSFVGVFCVGWNKIF